MMRTPIRVLLVDDSPIVHVVLKKLLARSPEIQVVGAAPTGREALEMIPRLKPQIICTDLHMPDIDGLELTQEVMKNFPTPILVISASVQKNDSFNIFKLLEAGAVDVFPKPLGGSSEEYDLIAADLINKIKLVAGVIILSRHKKKVATLPISLKAERPVLERAFAVGIVTIGASTGGPQAFDAILSELPLGYPVPIVCVQHISGWFLGGFIEWLNTKCRLKVKIAEEGELPSAGFVYFPPADYHLELDMKGKFIYSTAPPYKGLRPSVNATFKSVAKAFGRKSMGVLLTGMGDDGAAGMRDIFDAGGRTIAQDEESSVIFGMPRMAIERDAAEYILSLKDIANILATQVKPVEQTKL